MAKYRVTTPAPGFTGTSAGVHFDNGEAVVADAPSKAAALRYFRSAGYGVEEYEPEESQPADDTPDVPAEGEGEGNGVGEPAKPAGNASTEVWRDYAIANGLPADEVGTMSRDEIKAKLNDNKEGEGQ